MADAATNYENELSFAVAASDTDTKETMAADVFFGGDTYFGYSPDQRMPTKYYNESRFDDTELE